MMREMAMRHILFRVEKQTKNSYQRKRYFFNLFKTKKRSTVRPGAIEAAKLKKMINEIGRWKKVNIQRVGYDGAPDETLITVQIVDIHKDYFTGKFVNVERSIKQELDDNLVYLKGGGGTLDFNFDDGDIMSVEEDIDELVIKEMPERDLLSILDALDLNEAIIISYYDLNHGGVVNGSGKLSAKNLEDKNFTIALTLINGIELDKPKQIFLDLTKHKVLDLQVVI
jgi:hypothetical protein